MNEDQTTRLLRDVKITRNCMVFVSVLVAIAFAYNGFRVYHYYYGSDSQFHTHRNFYKQITKASQSGDDNAIVSLCQEKLSEEPNNTGALISLGEAYYRLGRWQDCIDTMNRLLAIAPTMEERVLPVIQKAQAKLQEE